MTLPRYNGPPLLHIGAPETSFMHPTLEHPLRSVDRPAGSQVKRRITLSAIALGACAGYYFGSLLGFQLRVLPATTSVLWPTNAILTSVLVPSAPRRWPAILLAI